MKFLSLLITTMAAAPLAIAQKPAPPAAPDADATQTLHEQSPAPRSQPDPGEMAREQSELSRALAEAGSSPVDYIRALESHLAKYPNSAQRSLIEKALAKSAMEASDNARIIRYGEKVLAAPGPDEDFQLLDRVIRALLDEGGADNAKRALEYAKRFERDVANMRAGAPQGHMSLARWMEQLDR
ncbi:MAG: hypothetical protein JO354_08275, partial [Verrucomicrobia bacterium]|nr:hypothetical protein [Verrucomicrobiota bacterium]